MLPGPGKRGPKPGSKTGPHKNSNTSRLIAMEVGDRRYIETTPETYSRDQSNLLVPKSRRPVELEGKEFSCKLFTAIGVSKVGEIRYLIAIERTK